MKLCNVRFILLNIPFTTLSLTKLIHKGVWFPTYPTSFLLRWQKNSNNAVDVPDINLQSVALMMMLTMKIN
ncbi:hypothetical protein HmCmsJML003_03037 [Escherichia coli]|nr:hypothetical protein HmCmsJML003_03037 [Escherichia coli]